MLSKSVGSIPFIFLVTDGAVEDERHICDIMKSHITGGGSIRPRICTFGIGTGFLCFIGGTDGILSATFLVYFFFIVPLFSSGGSIDAFRIS
jgi:hypothetical protein